MHLFGFLLSPFILFRVYLLLCVLLICMSLFVHITLMFLWRVYREVIFRMQLFGFCQQPFILWNVYQILCILLFYVVICIQYPLLSRMVYFSYHYVSSGLFNALSICGEYSDTLILLFKLCGWNTALCARDIYFIIFYI